MIQRLHDVPRERGPRFGPLARERLFMVLAALALRVAYAWVATGPGAQPFSDPADYDQVAWNLAHGVGFRLDGAGGPYPTAFVPPLVPWITSLLYRTTGHHDYFAAVLLQCTIGALLPLAVAALGAAVFGIGVGRVAGWLAVVHPLLVFFCGYLLTETVFTLLFVLALVASMEWVKTPRRGRALGAGLLWGVTALARPTALPMPLLVAIWAWIPLGLALLAGERLRQLAMLFLGLALVVAPWTIRNAVELHALVPVTTGAGGALMVGNNPEVWADPARRGGGTSGLWVELTRTEFRGLSETEVDVRARARALAFLRAHVREWPAMALAKLGRFWRLTTEAGDTGSWQRSGSPLRDAMHRVDPLLAWSVIVMPFALWGAVVSLRGSRRWFQSFLLWCIAYFSAIGVVFFGSLRMRVPAEPLVVLLAAAGFEDLRRRLRTRRRGLRVIEGGRAA